MRLLATGKHYHRSITKQGVRRYRSVYVRVHELRDLDSALFLGLIFFLFHSSSLALE